MKIGIGGIKFSEERFHLTHRAHSATDRSFAGLLREIANHRINLPFVCTRAGGEVHVSTFCIAAGDFPLLAGLLDDLPNSNPPPAQVGTLPFGYNFSGTSFRSQLEVIPRVGTLTLFPHRRDLALLGRVVEGVARSGIAIHSLCTSISALVLNIDYVLLDRAVKALEDIVVLPDNHAPFRPEFCVRQSNSLLP